MTKISNSLCSQDIYRAIQNNNIPTIDSPTRGSVVFCELLTWAEHSGIYIGSDKIIHLNGDGIVEEVNSKEFVARLGGANSLLTNKIYVSCRNASVAYSIEVARRAEKMLGSRRNYHMIFDNCHQFTSGCLTGNFENSDNFFWMLKDKIYTTLDADNFREWDPYSINASSFFKSIIGI